MMQPRRAGARPVGCRLHRKLDLDLECAFAGPSGGPHLRWRNGSMVGLQEITTDGTGVGAGGDEYLDWAVALYAKASQCPLQGQPAVNMGLFVSHGCS